MPGHHPNLSDKDFRVGERVLKEIKMKAQKPGIAREDLMPTTEELKQIIAHADSRLKLIICFLAVSRARVSEALSVELGKCRRGVKVTTIPVIGKGTRARDLRIKTELFDEIRREFGGSTWLFEHDGRQYNPTSVTTRIKQTAIAAVGKPLSAHLLRHYRGSQVAKADGIEAAADELGINVLTAKRYYVHSHLSDERFLTSMDTEI